MQIFYYIPIFIFGAIVGSFLNVVIYRLNTGMSIIYGRSMCFSCGKKLLWYELIPIISFIIQGGKCRGCKSKISLQYPIVEIVTGVLFLLTSYKLQVASYTNLLELVFLWIIMSVLVVITVYDIRHKIIPNSFVYSFIVLSALSLTWTSHVQVWDVLAGLILFLPFAALWFFSRGTWMGFGDAKLAWGIGWLLGLYGGISAIILAFWIGAVWGIVLIALGKINRLFFTTKTITMKSEIPFGPFLVLGTLLVFFFNVDIFSLVQIF